MDLYFLNHTDIRPYASIVQRSRPDVYKSPDELVRSFTQKEIREEIANHLRNMLTKHYTGHLVGRRPRFAAMATYFPHISLPPNEDSDGVRRLHAIEALQKTLYLARCLGVYCVEIVGGAGVPGPVYQHPRNGVLSPNEYREIRLGYLAESLCAVYDLSNPKNLLSEFTQTPSELPVVAIELEPGISFLMRDLDSFVMLRDRIQKMKDRHSPGADVAFQSVKLNVDVAHAFLIGYDPSKIKEKNLLDYVAHMHISDHAGHKGVGGAHAADLAPGQFHYFEDYRPWLEMAIALNGRRSSFSGVIAVEMEACNDIVAALEAIQTTRRWLCELAQDRPDSKDGPIAAGPSDRSKEAVTGSLLVVDIGNSTEYLLGQKGPVEGGVELERKLSQLCSTVLAEGGAVFSYTGDGLIALFDQSEFENPSEAATRALRAAKAICDTIAPQISGPLTARASLHWGKAYVPSVGRLADQIIGREVVCATRLCDWLAKVIEPSVPPDSRHSLIAATCSFMRIMPTADQEQFVRWGEADLKGIGKVEIFRHKATES
ncbi:hypothetical protein FJY63_09745 [Candidatus Sumerlaeota bacterium]|nr:hypothetical protein [Candidatus Sumerlaeota bacterium]